MTKLLKANCIFIKVLYPREIPYFSLISSNVFLYCQKMIKMNEIINSIILVVTPHQFETNTASGCVSLALITLVIFGYIFYSIVKERSKSMQDQNKSLRMHQSLLAVYFLNCVSAAG